MYLLKLDKNKYSLRHEEHILKESGPIEMVAFGLWNYNISKEEMLLAIEMLNEKKLKIMFDKNLKILVDT